MLVTAASVDDGTTAPEVLGRLTAKHRSRLAKVWADGKYHNHGLNDRMEREEVGYAIEVVSRPAGARGFVLWHRRRAAVRTFAWLGRYRRNGRDDEWSVESSEAMLKVCSIHRMLRLLKPDRSRERCPSSTKDYRQSFPDSLLARLCTIPTAGHRREAARPCFVGMMAFATPTITTARLQAILPSRLILSVLDTFRSELSKPTWSKAVTLTLGTLLARGWRTVAAALRQIGLRDYPHLSSDHQVFNRVAWSPRWVARRLL